MKLLFLNHSVDQLGFEGGGEESIASTDFLLQSQPRKARHHSYSQLTRGVKSPHADFHQDMDR